MKKPIFSIIIALHVMNDKFFEDLKRFKKLNFSSYEIIIITDKHVNFFLKNSQIRVVEPKKNIKLGEKRDLGYRVSRGDYCAYIDDDAYPEKNWLRNAYKIFQSNNRIAAVGGPNVNPPHDPFWNNISGIILSSYLTTGEQQYRFRPVRRYDDKELQGVNMIIKKSVLKKLGGFTNTFNYGDDTKIINDIRKLGYIAVSDPSVIVYHHRRIFPFAHLRQIYLMGKHRGYFVRKYPETSAPIYFLPVILAWGLVMAIVLFCVFSVLRLPIFGLFTIFYIAGVLSVFRYSKLLHALIAGLGIITTHLIYGVSFFFGYITKSMKY